MFTFTCRTCGAEAGSLRDSIRVLFTQDANICNRCWFRGKDLLRDHQTHEESEEHMGRGKHGKGGEGKGGGDDTLPVVVMPPPAKPDPAVIRAVTDYRVYEGEESLDDLSKPITWFMAQDGLVPVRKTPLGLFVGKGAGAKLPGLPALSPSVRLNVPRLAWEDLRNVVAFFKHIDAKSRSEAMVQYFWDPAAKRHVSYAPPQMVSGGGVHHFGDFDTAGAMLHLLDIHSHHRMGPFWSGTDDNDEKRFEGRLFGVIGYIDKHIPAMKWRTFVGGAFVDLQIEDVIDMANVADVEVNTSRTFKPSDLLRAAADSKQQDNTRFYFDYDPFDGATFPQEWAEAIVDEKDFRAALELGKAGDRDSRKGDCVVHTPLTMTAKEREDMKAEGFVEVRPGLWVPVPVDHQRILFPSHASTSASAYQGTTYQGGRGRDLNPHQPTPRNGSWTPSGGRVPDGVGGSSTQTTTASGNGGGVVEATKFLYERHTSKLYIDTGKGLYPSYQTLDQAARWKPGWKIDFVDTVDPLHILPGMWPGVHEGRH